MEAVAPLNVTQNLSVFNGWTEVCWALPAVYDRGPITYIGCYSTAAFDWTPQLWRRMSLAWNGPKKWMLSYVHPYAVGHDGLGWQWIETALPLAPWEGLVCPGLYVTGAPVQSVQMTRGRADIEGQHPFGAVRDMGEGNHETPAMGLRYRD